MVHKSGWLNLAASFFAYLWLKCGAPQIPPEDLLISKPEV
jgi:hypothetical protein